MKPGLAMEKAGVNFEPWLHPCRLEKWDIVESIGVCTYAYIC